AAAARASRRPAVQLGDQLARVHALGEGVSVTAVGAEDDVVGPKVRAYADGDRFLADVGVAGAVDQAALVRAGELFLAQADQEHATVEVEHHGSFRVQSDQ